MQKPNKTKRQPIRPKDGVIRSRDGKLVNILGLEEETGLSRHWIRRRIKNADCLPHIRVGQRILFDVDAVYSWLRAHQQTEAPTVKSARP